MNIQRSDADLIPESYQMRLMAWRDEFTRGYFEIGDIANEIILLNIQKGMKIEHSAIYSAVGRFCGKSGRTIRDYAEVAAFFPGGIREDYDILPFSHFRFAKTCGSEWENVLDYSMEHPDASEEKLAFEFLGKIPHQLESEDDFENYLQSSVALGDFDVASADLSVASSNPSVASKESSVAVELSGIFALSGLISQAESMLAWNLKKETKRKLVLALDGLKDVLSELSENKDSFKYDYDTKESPTYADIP